MDDYETLYPLEFSLAETPMSLQASKRSKDRWKASIEAVARARIRETYDLGLLLDRRPLAVTIYYFLDAPMAGDIDNIVKPILDALVAVAYSDDQVVERVVVQKFEPEVDRDFADPTDQLAIALDTDPPVVYVRVDDDLNWRRP